MERREGELFFKESEMRRILSRREAKRSEATDGEEEFLEDLREELLGMIVL